MALTRPAMIRTMWLAAAFACLLPVAHGQETTEDGKFFVVGSVRNWNGCVNCAAKSNCGCDDKGGKGVTDGGLEVGPGAADTAPAYDPGLLSGRFSAYGGGDSVMPSMIGDFFSNGLFFDSVNGNLSVANGGGDRRFKFNEHMSAIPMDRVFFTYNHFHNALVDINGVTRDLDRYLFGIEKSFLDELWSVEFRAPVVNGIGAAQDLQTGTRDLEFGNVALAIKRRVIRTDNLVASMGLGIVFPTGDDAELFETRFNGQAPVATYENESVHLLPFFGLYHTPTDRLFHQFFTQLDFDTSGNAFNSIGSTALGIAPGTGVLQDPTLLFMDYSVGYWLMRGQGIGCVTGIAPMIELHYSTTLQDQDIGNTGTFVDNFRTDVLNLTAGLLVEMGSQTYMQVAGVAPLRTEFDKQFDAEVNFYLIRRY